MKGYCQEQKVTSCAKVSHTQRACNNRVGYVTVLNKTKYSTVARRMLLLASAKNMKKPKRGLILLNRFETRMLHSCCRPAVCYETSVGKELQALRKTSSRSAGSCGRELFFRQDREINKLKYIFHFF